MQSPPVNSTTLSTQVPGTADYKTDDLIVEESNCLNTSEDEPEGGKEGGWDLRCRLFVVLIDRELRCLFSPFDFVQKSFPKDEVYGLHSMPKFDFHRDIMFVIQGTISDQTTPTHFDITLTFVTIEVPSSAPMS